MEVYLTTGTHGALHPLKVLDITIIIQGNLYWCNYPSPDGMVVGARVGVDLGVSDVGNGGGSVGWGEGSSVGCGVWVGLPACMFYDACVMPRGLLYKMASSMTNELPKMVPSMTDE